jgi:signal transduction histidine kinase
MSSDAINVLIVDDEPKNLAVLEVVLDDPAYRLVRAESADQALLALVAEEFALLILDIRMPDMNGLQLAQMIKERKKTASVPIIFLTAYYNEDQHALDGYDSGAVDYLHKPVNATVLRSKVAVFADLYRKSRELELANRALVAEVHQRRVAEQRLVEFNKSLEQRVNERTQALHEEDRRKNIFLATLAHELRNPLAPIRTAAQLLDSPHLTQSELQRTRAIVARQVTHMATLLDDLLDVARFTSGDISLRKIDVSLQQVLDAAIETAQPMIIAKNHRLQIDVPTAPLLLHADPMRLSQVISNLLANAAKYTDPEGQITLGCHVEDESVVIFVRDTGIGIAPEMRGKIFDIFVQADEARDRAQGGLGIGLTLVKALVELHGGEVDVQSNGRERGCQFTVKLPRSIVVEGPDALVSEADVEAGGGAMRRVLIADDNHDAAETLALLLRLFRHEVYVAGDGPAALELAERVRPDVAVLDIGMPGLTGYKVAERIRSEPWGRAMLLIAVTGWGQQSDKDKAQRAGFDHHLTKPVDPSELEQLLAPPISKGRSSSDTEQSTECGDTQQRRVGLDAQSTPAAPFPDVEQGSFGRY